MRAFQKAAMVIVSGLVLALAGSTAEAVSTCKVKINAKDGTILVSASTVSGTLLWGYSSGAETYGFANAGTCVSGGTAKNCTLGILGTAAAITPPPLCTLYLKDGVGTCSAYIKKCIPGARGHDFRKQTFVGEFAGNQTMTGTFNTGLGQYALAQDTTGSYNTAIGYQSLLFNNTGESNTAVGMNALFSNTGGTANTAVGQAAMQFNTTGSSNVALGDAALGANTTGDDNVAVGLGALTLNTGGFDNIGIGKFALAANVSGAQNVGVGKNALTVNSSGVGNTAVGHEALGSATGNSNTAVGHNALALLPGGDSNTAVGRDALSALNTTAYENLALGYNALSALTTGNGNIAIGSTAGSAITVGSGNIMIGNSGKPSDIAMIRIGNASLGTYIAGIRGITTGMMDAIPVLIDSNGQLGTISSSRRFKTDIHAMNDASSKILQLRPVTFRYKPELDPSGTLQYGLIAEEVAQVMPELVVHDKNGQIETVKYHLLATLLLNEVQKQQKLIAAQADLLQVQARALAELKTRMVAVENALPAGPGPLPASCGVRVEPGAQLN